MCVKNSDSLYLYDTEGIVDKEKQTIIFTIKYQPNLINKIEDQGELAKIANIRNLLFKYFDQQNILLYFQNIELVRFVDLQNDQFQQLDQLLITTIRTIFNLNKRQYKLLRFKDEDVKATKDGYIYFYNFEQNDNYDYTYERQIIQFLINYYLDNSENLDDLDKQLIKDQKINNLDEQLIEDQQIEIDNRDIIKKYKVKIDNLDKLLIEEYRDEISRLPSMHQILNHKLFQWLFKQRDFDKSRKKPQYKDILELYKRKESQKINIKEQFIYRFPSQYLEQVQWKQKIETLLFKIYVLDAFKDKVSKTLIGQDNTKLFEMLQITKIKLIKQISQELSTSQQSFNCLKSTIQNYLFGYDQSDRMNVGNKQIDEESCIRTYFKQLKETYNFTKNLIYLYHLSYLIIIKYLDRQIIMCPIIDQIKINDNRTISLPYQQIGFEEIGQLLISKNEDVIRKFLKGGCFSKIPNQEIH